MVDRFTITAAEQDPWIDADPSGQWVRYSDYAALEAQLAERVRVKPLQWSECRALYGGRKLVATDCFGREYARLDLKGQPDDFINDFKARVQEAYNTAILSALEATPSATLEAQLAEAKAAMRAVYDWMNQLPIPTTGCTSKMQLLYDALSALEATPGADGDERNGPLLRGVGAGKFEEVQPDNPEQASYLDGMDSLCQKQFDFLRLALLALDNIPRSEQTALQAVAVQVLTKHLSGDPNAEQGFTIPT